MKKKTSIIINLLAYFILSNSLFADKHYVPSRGSIESEDNYFCKVIRNEEIDSSTSITFYGDSRGDLVDALGYGEALNGWTPYFDAIANREWNIQNMAVAGWRIKNLYSHLVKCNTYKPDNEGDPEYTTATRYAFEIVTCPHSSDTFKC